MGSLGEWLGCASGPPLPSSGIAPGETWTEGRGSLGAGVCSGRDVETEGAQAHLALS